MSTFQIVITMTPDETVTQRDFVTAFQLAYDDGVAGQFQTIWGFSQHIVICDRDTADEDHVMLMQRIFTGASGQQAALQQLREEIEECMESGAPRNMLLNGQWTIVDFDAELGKVNEEAYAFLPVRPEPGTFWKTAEGVTTQVVALEATTEDGSLPNLWVQHPDGKRLHDPAGKPIGPVSRYHQERHVLKLPLGLHLPLMALPRVWVTPITCDSMAEALLRHLHETGKDFHPDDDPATIVRAADQTRLFLDHEAEVLRLRMFEVHFHHPDPCDFLRGLQTS